ncbi:MAG TPA: DNA polymerase III subunit alpha [Rhodanobacteraceae bacterium]
MSARFVHLHIHSEYSLVDSTLRIKPFIKGCAEGGIAAAALTDVSNLFALVKFYEGAMAAGIKPIAGCDIWIATPDDPHPWRMTLLCQHHAGYLNLSRLVSRAWREGQNGGLAVVDASWMTPATTDGLIALVGMESLPGRVAQGGNADAVKALLQPWQRLFPDRLYLELTRTGRASEDAWNPMALAMAEALDLPIVASNDVRFLTRDDFTAHEARVCIHDGRVLADPKRPHKYTPEQYLKSADEMAELFADLPEALENTVEIARRCNIEMSFGTYYLPQFPVPEGHNLDTYMRERAVKGLEERLAEHGLCANHSREDYDARLEHELETITKMGFPGYFLIVSDFISWAKEHDIPVGPGRGSGAGSVVAWALKITDLDPLQFDLLFERFLNPERVSMPDFDVDFCMDKRGLVIDYVAQKYGRDHVSQIVTYGAMAAKAVLRDCGRVLGMPYGQVDRIAKLIPARPLDLTLQDALGRSKKAQEAPDERIVKEFCELYDTDEEARPLIDLALSLEGITRNTGKHAGGVVIAPTPLTDFSPLCCEPDGGGVVTQFDKHDVEHVGLVKFDFLGLRTLTIIDWAVKAINARRKASGEALLDIMHIPTDDAEVFKMFRQARTVAVFQFEGGGMQRMLKEARPDRFEDLIALGALYRPGPMDLIPTFIRRKHGEEVVEYPDPRVEPVLKETYGIMVYQEQVMQMAQIIGGYTLGGADLLRRAMGKKKLSEMVKHRAIFAEGAARNGLDQKQADAIFDLMEKFAGYGFNKSHATAYALVSYQTAWLKTHYPAEFLAATISSDMDNTDKAVLFLNEARAIGIEILPPDVNASTWMFEAVEPRVIRYGLGAIKGVGRGVCEATATEREANGPYHDLADYCLRVKASGLNRRVLEALVNSGALDSLIPNRASGMAQITEAMRAADQQQRDAQAGQNDMFGAPAAAGGGIRVTLPTCPAWTLEQRLAGEHDTLGHYLSGHPTDPWRDVIAQLATCPMGEIVERYQPPAPRGSDDDKSRFRRAPETPWTVVGMVTGVRKRGETAAFARLEDATGGIEVSFFREAFDQYAALLTRDALLVVEGGLGIDGFSGDYQVRAKRVTTLAEACEKLSRLLRLKVDGIGPDFLARLRETVEQYRGGATTLRLSGYHNTCARADIDLGDAWRVHARPELVSQLRGLPGVLAAELKLARAN